MYFGSDKYLINFSTIMHELFDTFIRDESIPYSYKTGHRINFLLSLSATICYALVISLCSQPLSIEEKLNQEIWGLMISYDPSAPSGHNYCANMDCLENCVMNFTAKRVLQNAHPRIYELCRTLYCTSNIEFSIT